MSAPTHTPAPWAISKIGNNYDQYSIYGGGEDTLIVNSCEGIANARLIAAAPAMLGELKHALEWSESDLENIEEITPNEDMLRARVNVLREIIEKAEGRK